jgi:DNA transformation protein and related proteins
LLDAAAALCQNAIMKANRLSDMRNLGPKSEAMLAGAGVHTPARLAALGAVDTYALLRQSGQAVSLNMLWALEGALSDRDWRDVARNDKLRLLTELEARGVHV